MSVVSSLKKRQVRMLCVILTALSIVGALLSLPAPIGHAAVNPKIQVSGLNLVKSDANGNESADMLRVDDVAKLKFTWDASAADPAPGDSFKVELPAQFKNLTNLTQPLKVPFGDTEVGACVLNDTTLECTFNDKITELKNQGFADFKGSASALLKVLSATNNANLDFTVNDQIVPVAVPKGQIGEKPAAAYNAVKLAKAATPLAATSKTIAWAINFGSPHIVAVQQAAGVPPITLDGNTRSTIVFKDTLGAGQVFPTNPADFKFLVTNSAQEPASTGVTVVDGAGNDLNDKYGDFDFQVEVNGNEATFTVTGPFADSTNYRVAYPARPTTENGVIQPGFKYRNEVALEGTDASVSFERYYSDSFGVDVQMDPGFGALDVTKLVSGDGAQSIKANTRFDVTATYTLPDTKTTDDFPTWKAPGEVNAQKTGGTVTFPVTVAKKSVFSGTFPVGTVVELAEDTASVNPVAPGVNWGAPVFAVGNTTTNRLTIADQKSTSAMLTNTATVAFGQIQVKKTATGVPNVSEREFTFDYTCGAQQGKATAKGNGQPVVVPEQFPVGTQCTVTENAADAEIPGFALVPPNPVEVTVADATAPLATAEFTNTYTEQVGKFKVAKVLNDPDNVGAATKSFEFSYECTKDGAEAKNGDFTITGAGEWESPTVPVGYSCEVTEKDAAIDGATLVTEKTQPVLIEQGQQPTLTVTNTYTKNTGQFTITKQLDDPENLAAGKQFSFTYTCTPAGGGEKIVGKLGPIGVGESATSEKIPAGATCELVEESEAVPGVDLTTDGLTAITIVKGENAQVTVTNKYVRQMGKFKVVKQVNDAENVGAATKEFGFDYRCTKADAEAKTGDFTITGAGEWESPELPVGYSCEVTEKDAKIAGATLKATATAPVEIKLGETPTVTVTNTYTRDAGSIELRKTLDGSAKALPALATKQFSVDYTCRMGDQTIKEGTVQVAADTPTRIDALPTSTECTFTESAQGREVDGAVFDAKRSVVTVTGRVVDKNTTVVVELTNAYEHLGALTVSKQVVGTGALQAKGTQFQFEVSWPDSAAGPAGSRTFTLNDGASYTELPKLPVGTKVQVKETQPADTQGVRWETPNYGDNAPDGVVIIAEANTTVTVVNTATADSPLIEGQRPEMLLPILSGGLLLLPLLGLGMMGSSTVPPAVPTAPAVSAVPTAAPSTQPASPQEVRSLESQAPAKGAATKGTDPASEQAKGKTPAQASEKRDGALASTGASVLGVLLAAVMLLLGGFAVIAWATRRGNNSE